MNEELKHYIPIANMIAKTFGENCEVVIHDLSVPEMATVYMVNQHGVAKPLELSFEYLVRDLLLSKDFTDDYKANYFASTADRQRIKSSTAFIRDGRDKIIGALCIHFDLKQMQEVEAFLHEFLSVEEEEKELGPFDHVMEMVDGLIEQVVASVDVESLKRREKIELIQCMERKGVFLVKGSVEKVAEKLNISKVTVYSYLDDIKKNAQIIQS